MRRFCINLRRGPSLILLSLLWGLVCWVSPAQGETTAAVQNNLLQWAQGKDPDAAAESVFRLLDLVGGHGSNASEKEIERVLETAIRQAGQSYAGGAQAFEREVLKTLDLKRYNAVQAAIQQVINGPNSSGIEAVIRTGSSGLRHMEIAGAGSASGYRPLFSDDDISFVGNKAVQAAEELNSLLRAQGLARLKVKAFDLAELRQLRSIDLTLLNLMDPEKFLGEVGMKGIGTEMVKKGAVVAQRSGTSMVMTAQPLSAFVEAKKSHMLTELLDDKAYQEAAKKFGALTMVSSAERQINGVHNGWDKLTDSDKVKYVLRQRQALYTSGALQQVGNYGQGNSLAEIEWLKKLKADGVVAGSDLAVLSNMRQENIKLAFQEIPYKLNPILEAAERNGTPLLNDMRVRKIMDELTTGFAVMRDGQLAMSAEEVLARLKDVAGDSKEVYSVLYTAFQRGEDLVQEMHNWVALGGTRESFLVMLERLPDRMARARATALRKTRMAGKVEEGSLAAIEKMLSTPEGDGFFLRMAKNPTARRVVVGAMAVAGGAVVLNNMYSAWERGISKEDLSDAAYTMVDFIPGGMSVKRGYAEGIDPQTVMLFVKDALYLTPAWPLALTGDVLKTTVDVGAAVMTGHTQMQHEGLEDLLLYNGKFDETSSPPRLTGLLLPDNTAIDRDGIGRFLFNTKAVQVHHPVKGLDQRINDLSAVSNKVLDQLYVVNDPVIDQLRRASEIQLADIYRHESWKELESGNPFGAAALGLMGWYGGFEVVCRNSPEKWCKVYTHLAKESVDKRRDFLIGNAMVPRLIALAEEKRGKLSASSTIPPKLDALQVQLEAIRGSALGLKLSAKVKELADIEAAKQNDAQSRDLQRGEYWLAAFKAYQAIATASDTTVGSARIKAIVEQQTGFPRAQILQFPWRGDWKEDHKAAARSRQGYAREIARVRRDITKIKGKVPDVNDNIDRQAFDILGSVAFVAQAGLDAIEQADHAEGSAFFTDYAAALEKVKLLYGQSAEFQQQLDKGAQLLVVQSPLILGKSASVSLRLNDPALQKLGTDRNLKLNWLAIPGGTFRPNNTDYQLNFTTFRPEPVNLMVRVERLPQEASGGPKGAVGTVSVSVPVQIPAGFLQLALSATTVRPGEKVAAEALIPEAYWGGEHDFSYQWSCNNCQASPTDQAKNVITAPASGSATIQVALLVRAANGQLTRLGETSANISVAASTLQLVIQGPNLAEVASPISLRASILGLKEAERSGLRLIWRDETDQRNLGQGESIGFSATNEGYHVLRAEVQRQVGTQWVSAGSAQHRVQVKAKPDTPKKPDTSVTRQDPTDGTTTSVAGSTSTKTAPSCSYDYTEWGECSRTTKKQTRSVTTTKPEGCVERGKPDLERGCTPPPSEEDKKNTYLNCLCRCSSGWAGHIGVWYDPEQKTVPECKSSGPCIGGIGAFGCSRRHFFNSSTECAKGCWEGAYGKDTYDAEKANKLAKEENKKYKQPLSVKIKASKNPADFGEIVELTAETSEGSGGYKWNWGGCAQDPKDGNAKVANTRSCQACQASVTVTDSDGDTASDNLTIQCTALKVKLTQEKPKENRVPVGSSASFLAEVMSGDKAASGSFSYLWEHNPDASFGGLKNPTFETKGGAQSRNSATFGKLGTIPVWVTVLKEADGRKMTVGESEQIQMEVVKPQLTLSAEPKEVSVGQEVKLTVQELPKMSDDMLSFWWEIAGETNHAGPVPNVPNSRQYSFKPKSDKPTTVTVHAKAKDGGDELGVEKIIIQAVKPVINVTGPKIAGPAPMIWKEGVGLVPVGQQVAEGQRVEFSVSVTPDLKQELRYQWTATPEGCVVTAPASRETGVTCSRTGSYTVTAAVKNSEGADLGSGSASLSVTVSQSDINKGKQKNEASKKLEQARALWGQNKFDEALGILDAVAATDKDLAAPVINQFGQGFKKMGADALLQKDMATAVKRLEQAVRLLPNDQEAKQKLQEAKQLGEQQTQAMQFLATSQANLAKGMPADSSGLSALAAELIKRQTLFAPTDPRRAQFAALTNSVQQRQKEVQQKAAACEAKWTEGKALFNAKKLPEALARFKENLACAPGQRERETYVAQLEQTLKQQQARQAEAQRLRTEGEALQQQKRLPEAIAKYRDSLRLLPDPKLEQHIQTLERQLQTEQQTKSRAQQLRAEGEALQRQNQLPAAIAKYRDSLRLLPDPKLEQHIQTLERQLQTEQQTKSRAQQLRAEGETLQRQNQLPAAIAKYRESLTLVADPALQSHIQMLERTLQTQVTPMQPPRPTPVPVDPGGRSYTAIEPSLPVQPTTPKVLYDNGNISGVYNLPTRPTTFNLSRPATITSIVNYHWNDGRGSASTGTISLRDANGHIYGPWPTNGTPGQGGVPNAYWTARPNTQLPAGSYTVIDSNPASWAQNSGSNGAGHTRIEGY